jgi:hypothetical protein
MNDNMGIPPVEAPANKNRTLMIVVAVIVVLCCCCIVSLLLAYQFGDQVMSALGVY